MILSMSSKADHERHFVPALAREALNYQGLCHSGKTITIALPPSQTSLPHTGMIYEKLHFSTSHFKVRITKVGCSERVGDTIANAQYPAGMGGLFICPLDRSDTIANALSLKSLTPYGVPTVMS